MDNHWNKQTLSDGLHLHTRYFTFSNIHFVKIWMPYQKFSFMPSLAKASRQLRRIWVLRTKCNNNTRKKMDKSKNETKKNKKKQKEGGKRTPTTCVPFDPLPDKMKNQKYSHIIYNNCVSLPPGRFQNSGYEYLRVATSIQIVTSTQSR